MRSARPFGPLATERGGTVHIGYDRDYPLCNPRLDLIPLRWARVDKLIEERGVCVSCISSLRRMVAAAETLIELGDGAKREDRWWAEQLASLCLLHVHVDDPILAALPWPDGDIGRLPWQVTE